MASLEIRVNGGQTQVQDMLAPVMMIGRTPPAQILLESPFVSTEHGRIKNTGRVFELEDLHSLNGIVVNGSRITDRVVLRDLDLIEIGDCQIKVHLNDAEAAEKATHHFSAAKTVPVQRDDDGYLSWKVKVRERLLEKMNLKKLSAQTTSDDALRRITEERLDGILEELASELPAGINYQRFKKEIIDDTLALGPLEDLLEDESISEVMINGWDQIYVETGGKLQLSPKRFIDNDHVMAVIQRIVAPVGRTINESTPLVDARLRDGSRVNAIIPPLALTGPTLTIRKFSKRRLTAEALIRFGSINRDMVEFLELAVRERMNVVISGGTGSGKTTLLNILSGFIPNDERIITVEDAAELQLHQEHVVSLETRPPNMEGTGAITIRDLVKNCLRMRPDRIVIGECRGGEALDMLQAMNTGHDGSLTTAHANTPRDAISRLETMVLMSGMDLPVRAIREQIASAVNLIVQQSRLPDGSRKITHITEVTGMQGDVILLQDVFTFERSGFDEKGKVIGRFVAHDVIPDFVQDLARRGLKVNLEIFRNK
jgi:pilus assembly protein CpaF